MRLAAAGKIISAQRALELLEEGCDFALIPRAAILQRDFPLQVKANSMWDSPQLALMDDYLRQGGLNKHFIETMRGRQTFVKAGSL